MKQSTKIGKLIDISETRKVAVAAVGDGVKRGNTTSFLSSDNFVARKKYMVTLFGAGTMGLSTQLQIQL